MSKPDQRLPKTEIIRKQDEFDEIFQEGKRWTGSCVQIFYIEKGTRKTGFCVPKRLGKAVKRNRIKRLMREVYRRHRSEMRPLRIVMLARLEAREMTYRRLENDFRTFLASAKHG